MLDGDIVCLGSNLLEERLQQPRIVGIRLHVEKSGESEAYSLLFKRENTSVIHIGRRSGHEPDKCQSDNLTSAMFRCAVVSRKHAKIVFSDGGHVYIVDSNSHHGTHIRKSGEAFSKILKPEMSTMLDDGDTLTFGKAVGKGEEWVKPVTARVQLLCANAQPLTALTIPSPSSSDKSRSSSGRYGIHDSSSSSEDSHSSYSDIEEIPPPSPQKALEQGNSDFESAPSSLDLAQATSAYTAVKRLLSPAIRKLPSMSEIIGENLGFLDSSEKSQSIFNSFLRHDGSYSSSYNPLHPDFRFDSRSNSPMDLGSPSPDGAIVFSTPPPSEVQEIIGSPSHPHNKPEIVPDPPVDRENQPESKLAPPPSKVQAASMSDTQPLPNTIVSQPISASAEAKRESPTDISEVLQTLKQLEASVAKLQSSRRRYKTRFNSNVAFISRKLSEIDDKFAEVDAEYNLLCDQFDGVQHSDLPDLARQVEDLGENLDAILVQRSDGDHIEKMLETPPLEDREDVKASIKTLHELVDEMREVHDRTKTEVSKELVEIRAMREEAMKDIAKAKAEIAASASAAALPLAQVQTPVLTSLKRKRDDTDEDEDDVADTVDFPAGSVRAHVAAQDNLSKEIRGTGIMFDVTTMGTFEAAEFDDHAIHRPDEPPPRKRIRSVGSVIAHTATAVTIGAIITWSALAFS